MRSRIHVSSSSVGQTGLGTVASITSSNPRRGDDVVDRHARDAPTREAHPVVGSREVEHTEVRDHVAELMETAAVAFDVAARS